MTADRINQAYDYMKYIVEKPPALLVVLGSGLGDYAETLSAKKTVSYADIPGFPISTTPGHAGKLIFGDKYGKPAAVMQGRFHCYEGYTAAETVIPLRVLIKLGIKNLLVTNAAGGINASFSPGDLMLITDHINFASLNPLKGANMDDFGPRFPDMSFAYAKRLNDLLAETAGRNDIPLKRGVYAMMQGPSFETPAEIRMLRVLGADAVGMSTVPEIIAANHANIPSAAVSCITNMAAGIQKQPLTHAEVLETGQKAKDSLCGLIDGLIENI